MFAEAKARHIESTQFKLLLIPTDKILRLLIELTTSQYITKL